MNYALIENGVVTNLIWLYPGNAEEFPNAVAVGDRPVTMGDTYAGGVFARGGARVLTPEEGMIMELDHAVIDLTYENTLLELGVNA